MIGKIKKSLRAFFEVRLNRNNTSSNYDKIIEDEFADIYEKCKDYTLTSKERMYALFKAVEYTVNAKIEGDFVECGVWKGGSAMVIAYTLLKMKETHRKIYLYDTFEGMSKPSNEDVRLYDREPAITKWEKEKRDGYNEWTFAPLNDVKKNLASSGYPEKNLVFVKGKVEESIPKNTPSRIALLRLDTDWYESTHHELVHLFPLSTKHGTLIIDDYGHWAGSKKAVDEYFTQNKPILLNRVDYTGRVGIKV